MYLSDSDIELFKADVFFFIIIILAAVQGFIKTMVRTPGRG